MMRNDIELLHNGDATKIWIDLDNSPHVPFFVPIIEELEKRGYVVVVTARNCFQVCELAKLHHLSHRTIGRHYGKSPILKLSGLLARAFQLAPTVIRERPDVSLSHGSRSQLLISALLGVPSIVIMDYEFVRGLGGLRPDCLMCPEVIADGVMDGQVMKYPGIKEDVYIPRFQPDDGLRAELGLGGYDLMVVLRPPANEAHYHNPESEILLDAVLELLGAHAETKVVLLPRNHKQELLIRQRWPSLFSSGKITVPKHAVDGLNLIWSSDLVVSGGGTMNREAAALGVPVYSIFRGKIGAVDRYLATSGRLALLESVADVRTKIALQRRDRQTGPGRGNEASLQTIVNNVVKFVASKRPGSVAEARLKAPEFVGSTDVKIEQLNEQAIRALMPMFDTERQLFCYRLRQDGPGLVREGLSRRYTLMTLLGLHRSEGVGLRSPIDVRKVLDGLLRDVTWIDNIGDLGLALWACAVISPERLRESCSSLNVRTAFEHSKEVRVGRTMEVAWLLSGISHATLIFPNDCQDLADLAQRSYQVLQGNQGRQGIFGHLAGSGSISGYVRGRIGSFADQVYPIYALSKFGQAFGHLKALEMARDCADALCRLQGPLGQWWWHYDALTGRVVERYPVYSVHQEGMAPMALFALQAASGTDYSEAIYKGLRWIAGQNELDRDLRHPSGLVWRCVSHRSRRRVYWDRALNLVGATAETQGASDLRTLHECRPYELGWLLYAFAGR